MMRAEVFAIDFGNIMGIIGMVLSILAFAYVQTKKPNMILYNFIVACSSGSLLVSLYYRPNIGSIIMEAFWVAGGIIGMVLAIKRRKNLFEKQKATINAGQQLIIKN